MQDDLFPICLRAIPSLNLSRQCWKNLGRVRETSAIVGVGKRARVPESKYKYFVLKQGMYDVSRGNGREISMTLKMVFY